MSILDKIKSPADTRALTPEELLELTGDIRQSLIQSVSTTGGHLGSNLGVVELTVALHHVFNLPEDRIVWDVSHQVYVHKMLTGRLDRMNTLRQYKGLAGFAKRSESDCDPFGAGHASTSISAALGLAVARDMAGKDHKVMAVIGDGSMTGGLAFEGMNNAGSLKKDLLVILNDNTWSISKNVGSLSKYLTGILTDEKFVKLRNEVWELTGRFKRRDQIREAVSRIETSVKGLLVPGLLFEKLGFKYFGPIDGHDLPLLIKTLQDVKNIPGPIMLHIATVKGKGYGPAESDVSKFHGIGKFDTATGETAPAGSGLPQYTKVFGKTMIELADRDDKVVAITAAMAPGTGLVGFAEKHPDRFFDVGIAEGHAGTFAAGLVAEGAKPYLTVYSTFMQRAYDQVIHDMAVQNLPVVICMDRGGLVGNDGPTHHGAFDLTYMAAVPGLTLAAPKDGNELRSMLHHTVDAKFDGPVAIRYPRGSVPVPMDSDIRSIEWGTWEWLTDPSDIVILAVGAMVTESNQALKLLAEQGIKASLINARFVKPFDLEVLEQVRRKATVVVTVEENSRVGGFGERVGAYLLTNGYDGAFLPLGLPDRFVTHGNRDQLLREVELDPEGIAHQIEIKLSGTEETDKSFLQRIGLKRNGSAKRQLG